MITGSLGQLGRCLQEVLSDTAENEIVLAVDVDELDIADSEALQSAIREAAPDVLVNAAAFTAVDLCESKTEIAHQVNAVAPGQLARAALEAGARFVHVSTDYVFDGKASEPYPESAAPAPLCEYGRSKLSGEQQVFEAVPDALVVRTSSVFGPGKNFVVGMLRQAGLRRRGEVTEPMRVVDDQRSCPTYAFDLAQGIVELVQRDASGLYHLSNAGIASWWEVARVTLDLAGYEEIEIETIATDSLDLPAARPLFSALNTAKAASIGVQLRPWREALAAYLDSEAGLSETELSKWEREGGTA